MKPDVRAFIAVDMHRYLGARLQFFTGRQLIALHVCPDDVIALTSRYPLSELTGMIGIEFPARFLLIGPPNLNLDRVELSSF